MNTLKELKKLKKLFESGVISQEEFNFLKSNILGTQIESSSKTTNVEEDVSNKNNEAFNEPEDGVAKQLDDLEKETNIKQDTVKSYPTENDTNAKTDKESNVKKEEIKRSNKIRNLLIFAFVFMMISFSLKYFGIIEGNNPGKKLSSEITHDYPEIINDLLLAEENRNLEKIISFYSRSMIRYWDTDYPTKDELKKKYEYIWSFTKDNKNNVESIEKISDTIYDIHTQFEYYNINKDKHFSVKSVVRYVFGTDGKIIKVYGVDDNVKKETNDYANKKRIINKYEDEDAIKETYVEEEVEEFEIESAEVNQEAKLIEAEESEENLVVALEVIENVPIFPGCDEGDNDNKRICLSEKIRKFVNREFNTNLASDLGLWAGRKRIFVSFKIDKSGSIIDIHARGPHPGLEKEAKRVIGLLPKMQPGKHSGKIVIVPYSLPIVLFVED